MCAHSPLWRQHGCNYERGLNQTLVCVLLYPMLSAWLYSLDCSCSDANTKMETLSQVNAHRSCSSNVLFDKMGTLLCCRCMNATDDYVAQITLTRTDPIDLHCTDKTVKAFKISCIFKIYSFMFPGRKQVMNVMFQVHQKSHY